MTTNFQVDLERGQEVERAIDQYFVKKGVVVKDVSVADEIAYGYDRIFHFRNTVTTVEYKFDDKSRLTSNFFLEWEIINAQGDHQKDGWLLHSQADRLMIYGGRGVNEGLYIITRENLTTGIEEFKTFPLRKSVVTDSGSNSWRALGYCVSTLVFAKYCHKFVPTLELDI